MATSGSFDFSTTRDDLIKGALRILGVIPEGGTPSTEQYNTAAEALNMLVKAWGAEGLGIWAIKKQTVTLVDGTNTYAVGLSQTVNIPRPLMIYQAWLHDTSSNVDVPMIALSQEEYNILGNKTSEGNPVNYYYEALRNTGNLYLFPTPDSSAASGKTVVIQYQAPIEDFDASTDEPDVPQELFRALKFNLAAELSFEYGYPIKDRQQLLERAEYLKEDAFGIVQEDASVYFQVNVRNF
jgi:hypothetical protein